jgi:DUF4097 and DUF4098 domain-containing protein YvlB
MRSTPKFMMLALCGLVLSSFLPNAALGATGSFQQTVSVDESISLDVSTGSGSISIISGPPGQVEVKGKIKVNKRSFLGIFKRSSEKMEEMVRAVENDPPVRLIDGKLMVGHIDDKAHEHNLSISYEIVVPADTEVKSHTGSGSQTISNVAGPVEANAGSGKITLTDIGGAVKAHTGSGAIHGNNIAGAFEARAGSGSIRLTQVAPGDVVVRTGSGSSKLHGVVGALQARAGSGRIEVDGRQEGPWSIDTGSGSVRIKLPVDAAFDLDAHTGSGGINIDHPLTVQGKVSRKNLKGTVRGGGEPLTVETGSGGIRIE